MFPQLKWTNFGCVWSTQVSIVLLWGLRDHVNVSRGGGRFSSLFNYHRTGCVWYWEKTRHMNATHSCCVETSNICRVAAMTNKTIAANERAGSFPLFLLLSSLLSHDSSRASQKRWRWTCPDRKREKCLRPVRSWWTSPRSASTRRNN